MELVEPRWKMEIWFLAKTLGPNDVTPALLSGLADKHGVLVESVLVVMAACPECGGDGKCPACEGGGDCSMCGGGGERECGSCGNFGDCEDCKGTGNCQECDGEKRCTHCEGSGQRWN